MKQTQQMNSIGSMAAKMVAFAMLFFVFLEFVLLLVLSGSSYSRLEQMASDSISGLQDQVRAYYTRLDNTAAAVSYSKAVQTFLLDDNTYKRIESRDAISDIITYSTQNNPDIRDVILVDGRGSVFSFRGSDYYPAHFLTQQIEAYQAHSVRTMQAYFYAENEYGHCMQTFVYPIYDVNAGAAYRKQVGAVVLVCAVDQLEKTLLSMSENPNLNVRLCAGEKVLISAGMLENDDLWFAEPVNQAGWMLNASFNGGISDTSSSELILLVIINALVGLALMWFFLLYLNRKMVKPIHQLCQELKDISDNGQKKCIVQTSIEEIDKIVQQINEMNDGIQRMNREIMHSREQSWQNAILLNKAQIQALRNQINPHFLYNTLQCVRGLALQHKAPEIAQIATCMGEIFRYTICGDECVPFSQELEQLERYLSIIHIRFQGQIQHRIETIGEVGDILVPKMILQPLAENAVKHGLELKRGEKLLCVRVERTPEILRIMVQDNGLGIAPDKMKEIQSSLRTPVDQIQERDSIGLLNIHHRVRLQAGESYGITVQSGAEGTCVSLRLPLTLHQERWNTCE